jgi:hypothetical protein
MTTEKKTIKVNVTKVEAEPKTIRVNVTGEEPEPKKFVIETVEQKEPEPKTFVIQVEETEQEQSKMSQQKTFDDLESERKQEELKKRVEFLNDDTIVIRLLDGGEMRIKLTEKYTELWWFPELAIVPTSGNVLQFLRLQ